MSEGTTRIDPRWRPPIAASLTLLLVALVLAIQHARHGWPFSLHHGMPPIGPDRAGSAEHAAMREAEHEGQIPGAARTPIELEAARLEALGVTFEAARLEDLGSEVRAVVTVVPDEARLAHVHTRVSGWIDRLHVRTTGEQVRAGQPLASIFSRELLASQTEYLSVLRASRGTGSSPLAAGARQRLVVLGMTDAEIRALERRGEPARYVPVLAPRAGAVLHRGVTVGTAVDPSTELFVIGDLSTVWALAEIPEAHVPDVQVGSTARIEVPAAAVDPIEGAVSFVYPTLTERTRTLRVRFELPNPDGALRPGMFGTAVFEVARRRVLTVPRDAIVDTGRHQHVFVRTAPGRLEPRPIMLGARMGDRVAVSSGLSEGDIVASSGVFLIDSESRLRATGGGSMPGMEGMEGMEGDHEAAPAAGGHAGHGG